MLFVFITILSSVVGCHSDLTTDSSENFPIGQQNNIFNFERVRLLYSPCDEKCEVCYGPLSTECSQCVTFGTFQSFLANGNQCLDGLSCPARTFPDNSNHQCTVCDVKCLICTTSVNNCTSCVTSGPDQAYLDGQACVPHGSCSVGTYPNSGSHVCEPCDPKCIQCTNSPTNCTSCKSLAPNQAFLDLDGETCVSPGSCTAPSFENTGSRICEPCNPKCLTCSGSATNCQSCVTSGSDQAYLDGSACVQSTACPSQTFANAATHQCSSCDLKCLVCTTSATNCTSCVNVGANQAFLDTVAETCVVSTLCPALTFANSGNHRCDSCYSKCLVCTTSASNCTFCVTSGVQQAFLDGESCILGTACPSTTFANSVNHVCDSCDVSCLECSIIATNCSSCPISGANQGFLKDNICYDSTSCPIGTYADVSTHECQSCDPKCTQCSTSSTNCQACQTVPPNQSFLNANQCVLDSACPSNTFANSVNHICDPCDADCKECDAVSTNCTSCPISGANQGFLLNNACVTAALCPIGTFADTSVHQCKNCNIKCTQCTTTSTNCQACKTSPPDQAFLSGTQCVISTACPAGRFANTVNHLCSLCDVDCKNCQGIATNCTSCPTSGVYQGFLLNNACVAAALCPTGTFANAATHICNTCNVRCTLCSVTSTNCSQCKPTPPNQSFLNGNLCVTASACPAGRFANSVNHVCDLCDPECKNCQGTSTNCTSCPTSGIYEGFLTNNACVDNISCPAEQFPNLVNHVCTPCDPKCTICSVVATNCSACQDSPPNQAFLFADTNQCMSSCPNQDYYQNQTTHTCEECDPLCQTCDGFPDPCFICYPPNIFLNDRCFAECPDGYYQVQINSTRTCLPCNQNCTLCYGPTINNCTACQPYTPHRLSNKTCAQDCLPGYGLTEDTQVCVKCFQRCAQCFNLSDNCSSCITSGGNKGYYLQIQRKCYGNCPNGYFKNQSAITCDVCLGNCSRCDGNPYRCTDCITGLFLKSNEFFCYDVCPIKTFENTTHRLCSNCDWTCVECDKRSWNCTICNNSIPAFYKPDFRCYVNCPDGFYEDIPSNYTCSPCDSACTKCDGNPTPCSECAVDFYYYQYYCYDVCPLQILFGDDVTGQCKLCEDFCTDLQIKIDFTTKFNEEVVVQMKFNEKINFTTFPYKTFQVFKFSDPLHRISQFKVSFNVTSDYSYQIFIKPIEYMFLYNVTLTVTTIPIVYPKHQAINNRPFKQSVYSKPASIVWFLIQAPNMSETQKETVAYFAEHAQLINNFTSLPGVQQIKKSGLLGMLAPGVQITSAMLLVHNILPRNFYQGVRLIASLVLYQTANWEQDNQNQVFIFGTSANEIIKYFGAQQGNSRLLQVQPQWRLKRAGFTTFFVLDAYIPILAIVVVWIVLGIMYCGLRKDPYCRKMALIYSIFHKIHEVSIIYMTIAIILEWFYFDGSNNLHWISVILSVVFVLYFMAYHLYMYYDLHQYPKTSLGTAAYSYYVTKYGSFLSSVKYQQYEVDGVCSAVLWVRPYNYNILSFYKKVLMISALAIFHQTPVAQIGTLCILQIIQIVRFCLTWPYYRKSKNIARLLSEINLLAIFVVMFILCQISFELQRNDPLTLQSTIYWFYALGWLGLSLVFLFNFFWLAMAIAGIFTACCQSNRKEIDQIRKKYYFQKLDKYQDKNEDIDHAVVRDWVRKGNLDDKIEKQDFNTITVKVQTIQVTRFSHYFQMKVNKISDLRLKPTPFIIQSEQKRLHIVDKINRVVEVTKSSYNQLFETLSNIFMRYGIKQGQSIKIKTYLTIDLEQYPKGGRVLFYKNMMHQKLQILKQQKQVFELKEVLQGFPLKRKLLE